MGVCSKCGTQLVMEAAFCSGCGVAHSVLEAPLLTSVLVAPTIHDDASRFFIGKNYDYFLRKWEIAEKKSSKQSWNWAAFLLGFLWMPYRKMYLYSAIFIGVIVVETLCEIVFGVSNSLSSAISLGIAIALGMQGNALYKLHVEKKTKEIMATNTPEQAKIELVKQGGTSVAAAVGFAAAFVSIMVLIAFAGG